MKALVGVPDSAADGFHWTNGVEILTFKGIVCRTPDCGCDRSWSGIASTKGSTLARVTEMPENFRIDDDLIVDERVAAALRLAANYPVGTLLRARYDWKAEPNPQFIPADRFVAAWRITVVT